MSTADSLMTLVDIPGYHPKIQYRDSVSFIGSCFAEHISSKLLRYKYDVLTNPFGILYNPISMATALERIAQPLYYQPDDLIYHDGLYHSMDHHGVYSGKNEVEVIKKINSSIDQAHHHLKKNSFVFISPGTSRVYKFKSTGNIVGNCHKIPQASFEYSQLNLSECLDAFEKIYSCIKKLSPSSHILWTVSPVRHVRDGLVENQRSKSALILAIDQVIKNHPDTGYFPAYEIMLDQLRDYRYYARDLIHPSEVAIDIIWDLFRDTFMDPHEREYHASIEKIKRAMEHRWLHDDREAIRSFAQNQLKQVDHLATLLPDLNWQPERQYFFQYLEMD